MKKWQRTLLKPTIKIQTCTWTELADHWEIVIPQEIEDQLEENPFADEEWLAEKVKEKINSITNGDEVLDLQALSDLYYFVDQVAKYSQQTCKPAIKGLLKIDHPWTFNKWVANNLEFLWT